MATKQMEMLHFFVLLLVCSSNAMSQTGCPQSCTCNLEISMSWLTCTGSGQQEPAKWTTLTQTVQANPLLKHIGYHWGLAELPYNIPQFDGLLSLNLSQNYIQSLRSDSFGVRLLSSLDLSFNALQYIDANAFRGLPELRTLNVSDNRIASLSSNVFSDLGSLRMLILKQNRIKSLPEGIFTNLQDLEVLDLSFNHITFLSSKHFDSLLGLRELYLNSNLLKSIHYDAIQVITHIPLLDLSNNPLECTCALIPLKEAVDAKDTKFMKQNSTFCTAPRRLAGISLENLPVEELNCTSPSISYISDPQVIPYQHDLYLPCRAEGVPAPAILWLTPWGHEFAHPSQFHLIGDRSLDLHPHHAYKAKNVILVSNVNLYDNGTLHISKFRGYFAGNFTCVALNPEGNSSATVHVEIYHFLQATYYGSLFMSGYTASACLVAGIIGGIIRVIYTAISRRLAKKKKEAEIEAKEEEKAVSVSDIVVTIGEFDDRSDPSPPKTPLLSPVSSTPESPRKCTTPTEDPGWLPANIFDQLDEVRWRLRYGVGRKIEKVRNQVQSIRESSTVYMQSIKDSGSSAANRVRTGIVIGVETMKYSVQSLKEFCGTGDMGQTVSMISVSTDVDTSQRTEVIKTVTFV